jgi:hypothetical protein
MIYAECLKLPASEKSKHYTESAEESRDHRERWARHGAAWLATTAKPQSNRDTYLVSAAMVSMTRARVPSRSYNLPVAMTRFPANSMSRSFWPAAGILSETGQ